MTLAAAGLSVTVLGDHQAEHLRRHGRHGSHGLVHGWCHRRQTGPTGSSGGAPGDASFGMTGMEVETAVRMGLPTLTILINNGGIGGGVMGMNRPAGTSGRSPNWEAILAWWHRDWELTVSVEQPGDLIPAYRRAIRATEDGQAALVEVMIKPMRTPELPDDWAL